MGLAGLRGLIVTALAGGGSAAALALVPAAAAAPGDLDPSFSVDGKQVATFGAHALSSPSDSVVAADGAIYVAGAASETSDGPADIGIIRLRPNGDLDPAFGDDGRVTVDLGGNDVTRAIAIAPGGGLYVASSAALNQEFRFAVLRFAADGELDRTFSDDGIATTLVDGSQGFASDLAVLADGDVMVAGTAFGPADWDLALARFNGDGSPDSGLGGDGTALTDLGGHDSAESIAVLGDGRAVVGGGSVPTSERFPRGRLAPVLARFEPDGELDLTFSDDGVVHEATRSVAGVTELALGPGGTYLAGGQHPYHNDPSLESHETAFVIAYDEGGERIGSKSHDGMVIAGLALDDAGRLVIGYSYDYCARFGGCSPNDFRVRRYLPDGAPDPAFGGFNDGIAVTGSGRAKTLALQPDQSIVVAGSTGSQIAIFRFLATQGPRDADADGVYSETDPCEGSYAPADPVGCQRFERRVVDIRQVGEHLRGSVTTTLRGCDYSYPLVLLRKRGGRDEVIKRTGDLGANYSVEPPLRRGRYYIRLPEKPTYYGMCETARSKALRFSVERARRAAD